jgi:RimJ/RimL family protein N-acetyltransferase
MEKILLFIKHNFRFLWKIIEGINSILFSIFYKDDLEIMLSKVFQEPNISSFSFRRLDTGDAETLAFLIDSQETSDLMYFRPHGFDLNSIQKQFKNRSFLMMGAYDKERLTGYFFLRFFANRKCFVGRLIDKEYRGKGIGLDMNRIMYETAWRMGFRCLSTISRDNKAVIQTHAKNPTIVILKELQNNYLLVEFIRDGNSKRKRNPELI